MSIAGVVSLFKAKGGTDTISLLCVEVDLT